MPNWKKVIVSGSDASLNSLTVVNGITGSLFGTASYATQALNASTASYVLQAVSASFATNANLLDNLDSTAFAQLASANTFTNNQIISGSLTVFTGSGIEFQVTNTGTKIGNIISDVHTITGSVGVSGSVTATSFTGAGSFSTLTSTSTTTLASSTATQTVSLGAGATTAASTKTINIGTSGVSTSITNVNIGSAVDGAVGTITLNENTIISGSLTVFTGSVIEFQVTNTGTKIGNLITDNHTVTGSVNISGSVTAVGFTGPLTGTASYASQALNASTASYVVTANTASYVLQAVSASFATNANLLDTLDSTAFAQLASANRFTANQVITGSLTATGDIITQGNIVAQQYIVSSSVAYFTESFSSGSTKFGNSLDDTHQFTGSVNITGSLNTVGDNTLSGSLTIYGPNGPNPNIKTQNSSLILEGNAGGGGTSAAQLRITSNPGAWTDNILTSYFQIRNSGSAGFNNNVTFQGGTYGTDAPFDRLQFASYYTSFNNGAYGTTPVPTASFEIINSNSGTIPLLQLKTLVGQTSNYVNITSGSTTGNVFNITKDGVVAIGTTNTSTEANLFLGAKGTDEGGQLIFQKGTSQASASMLDNYQNTLRVLTGTDTTSVRMDLELSHVTQNLRIFGDVIAYASSDKRLKTNIQPIENPLDKLNQISGYTFDWDDKITVHGHEGHDIGVIAQEIEEVLPEVVTTRDNGYKAVKYEKIIPLLIEAIKELKAEVDSLKSGNYNKWD